MAAARPTALLCCPFANLRWLPLSLARCIAASTAKFAATRGRPTLQQGWPRQPDRNLRCSCWYSTDAGKQDKSTAIDLQAPTFVYRPRLDFDFIRENADAIRRNIQVRNVQLPLDAVDKVLEMYNRVKALRRRAHQLSEERAKFRSEASKLATALWKLSAYRKNVTNEESKRIEAENEESADIKRLKEEEARCWEKAKAVKVELHQVEAELVEAEEAVTEKASDFPNLTHPSVPVGDETKARIIAVKEGSYSSNRPPAASSSPGEAASSAPPPLDHVAILQALHCLDFNSAGMASGSHMYYLKNEAALLEIALIQYGMSCAVARGWTPVITPDIVREDMVRGCGFAPREGGSASKNYEVVNHCYPRPDIVVPAEAASSPPQHPGSSVKTKVHGQVVRYLSATAEIPLSGLVCDRIWPESDSTKRFVGFGRAYRAEAPEALSLYRVHQFSKVELYATCLPHESDAVLEEIRELQEDILRGLGLQYRVLDMPSEELGASAYRKYDIEAWMPGRGMWGEVSSASNCTDYQARRIGIRFRPKKNSDPRARPGEVARTQPLHTLNGTACAVPRLIIALVEQGQVRFDVENEEGEGKSKRKKAKKKTGPRVGFRIPEVLRPWMLGVGDVVGKKIEHD